MSDDNLPIVYVVEDDRVDVGVLKRIFDRADIACRAFSSPPRQGRYQLTESRAESV